MKQLASTISSLDRIGLTNPATRLRAIQLLLKHAATTDFSKEQEVLAKLSEIVEFLDGKDINTLAPAGMSLPAYSLETSKKYVVYAGDDLEGFSKGQIFGTGIPNFLKSFTEHYMAGRLESLAGEDLQKYQAVREELESTRSTIRSSYRTISKPPKYTGRSRNLREISKNEMRKERDALKSVYYKLGTFQSKIRGYAREWAKEIAKGSYEDGKLTYAPSQEDELKKLQEEARAKLSPLQDVFDPMEEDFAEPDEDMLAEFEAEQETVPSKPLAKKKKPKVEQEEDDTRTTKDKEFIDLLNRMKKKKTESQLLSRIATRPIEKNIDPARIRALHEGILHKLTTLDYNFQSIRDKIDGPAAAKLGMSVEEFRATLNIEALLAFDTDSKKAVAASALDKIKQLEMKKKEPKSTKRKDILHERARQAVRSILSEKYVDDKGKLFSIDVVLKAWDSLKESLFMAYETFVAQLVRYYKAWRKQDRQTPEQEKADRDAAIQNQQDKQETLMIEADTSLRDDLTNAIQILRG